MKNTPTTEKVEEFLKNIPQSGFAMEILENNGAIVKLKVVVPANIGIFKVQGKIIGQKEILAETKSKIEKHLKANFDNIKVIFV
ncbi:hypothetical protein KO465_05985 [Candidatus Micrarchaeota archaeon]|nr:hypothetical protein [Candidatus Micrarchaeota archaeon]